MAYRNPAIFKFRKAQEAVGGGRGSSSGVVQLQKVGRRWAFSAYGGTKHIVATEPMGVY